MENSRNFVRLSILLLDFSRNILMEVLKKKIPLPNLYSLLDTQRRILMKNTKFSQKTFLYPKGHNFHGSYEEMDFSLLCILSKCLLQEASKQFHMNIDTLITVKSSLFSCPGGTEIDEQTFVDNWTKSKNALLEIGSECLSVDKMREKIDILQTEDTSDGIGSDKLIFQSSKVEKYRENPEQKSYKWTKSTTRFLQVCALVLEVGTVLLRRLLYDRIQPQELLTKLMLQRRFIYWRLPSYQKAALKTWETRITDIKFDSHSYDTFDISLCYYLFRRLGVIPQHTAGWSKPPLEKDMSLAAQIERLNALRHILSHYKHGTELQECDFEQYKLIAISCIRDIKIHLDSDVVNIEKKIGLIFEDMQIEDQISSFGSDQTFPKRQRSLPLVVSCSSMSDCLGEEYSPQSCNYDSEDQSGGAENGTVTIQKALERLKQLKGKNLFKAFLGYSLKEPEKLFIVAYLKHTSTKCKYWDDFETFRVLYIDCMYVEREGANVMHSPESLQNRITYDDMTRIQTIITEQSDDLMKKHSNLEMISASSVKSCWKEQLIVVKTCIVLYCRTKGIIPSGEDQFPKELGGYPTDVREGLFQWAPGDNVYQSPNEFHHPLKMGCNIGLRGKQKKGSLGGFIDTDGGMAFLTCAHVLYDKDLLENHDKPSDSDYVVQPAESETKQPEDTRDRVCGKVLTYVFDPTGPVGVDAAAVVMNSDRRPEQGMFAGLSKASMEFAGLQEPVRYNSGRIKRLGKEDNDRRVIKSGASTGLTRGVFYFNGASVKVFDVNLHLDPRSQQNNYFMKGQLEILGVGGVVFAQPGDSGSLVFIVESDDSLTCIGMVEGWTTNYSTIVTPIKDILDKLELDNTKLYTFPQPPRIEED